MHAFLKEKHSLNENGLIQRIKNNELDIYAILREFVVYLDNLGDAPKSIRTHMSGVNGYLRYLGIKISSDDYKYLVKTPKPVLRREKPITKEMIVRLLHSSPPKLQAAILVSIASGMRIGELVSLQLRDIDFSVTPTKIRIRAETTKTRQARETFLTSEATRVLKDYLTRFHDWNEEGKNLHLERKHIFARTSSRKLKYTIPENEPLYASMCLQSSLNTFVKKIPELGIRNDNGRKLIHFHAFRKFFRTTVGNVCGRDFAEAIIGHQFYMDTYYVLSEEQKRELYLKAEPYLTISDFKLVEQNMVDLSAKYTHLESQFEQLKQYLRLNSIQIPDLSTT
jgi:integrase